MLDGPSRAPSRAGRRRAAAALVLPGVLALTGCGFGAPRAAPPSGVDGLEVPTPAPDPADFVARVDNPWLPLAPGSRWTYRSSDGRTVEVSVPGTTRVAGVEATAVETVERSRRGRVVEQSTSWFAQDRAGNVWHLGEEGVWRTGEDGALAGLAMPATPRVGDGFVQEQAAGVALDESRVLAVDARRSTLRRVYDDLVEVEETSPLEPGLTTVVFYAREVGMVVEESSSGADLQLVDFAGG
jgi:hypothetical protein